MMLILPLKKFLTVLLTLVGVLFLAALIPGALGQPPAGELGGPSGKVASDRDKIQGKWQIQSITMDGKVHKREDKSPLWKVAFHNDLQIQGDRLTHGLVYKGEFQLDDTKDPKQITVKSGESKLTFRGTYALEGQNLKVSVSGFGKEAQRPGDSAPKPGAISQIVIDMKRAPAKK